MINFSPRAIMYIFQILKKRFYLKISCSSNYWCFLERKYTYYNWDRWYALSITFEHIPSYFYLYLLMYSVYHILRYFSSPYYGIWIFSNTDYWWSITHSLPRHGRFLYLTETMTKSHCSTQQTLLKSDVKNKDISNILVKMKEKTCTFQNILIKSLISREKYCCSMNSSCSELFKTVPDVIFTMFGSHLIWFLSFVSW